VQVSGRGDLPFQQQGREGLFEPGLHPAAHGPVFYANNNGDGMVKKQQKKVIAIEIESTNHQSERCAGTSMMRREADAGPSENRAGPDQSASGTAGTGQENEELEWARRHVPPDPILAVRKTEIIGWGVQPVHKRGWRSRQKIPKEEAGAGEAGMTAPAPAPAKPEKSPADMILILAVRMERIAERLNEKILRLGRRVTELEKRGRP